MAHWGRVGPFLERKIRIFSFSFSIRRRILRHSIRSTTSAERLYRIMAGRRPPLLGFGSSCRCVCDQQACKTTTATFGFLFNSSNKRWFELKGDYYGSGYNLLTRLGFGGNVEGLVCLLYRVSPRNQTLLGLGSRKPNNELLLHLQ
jgi:hypothetical protein